MKRITIKSQEEYQDFLEFLKDPDVEIIGEGMTAGQSPIYTMNTNEMIMVPKEFVDQKYNSLIFGKDRTENIVSIDVDENLLWIYKEINGEVRTEVRPNKYWITSPKKLEGFKRLIGSTYYKWIYETEDRDDFIATRKMGFKFNMWSVYQPEEATMIRQGLTYYKGMKVEDVSVLAFDIETTGLDPEAGDAQVVLIANTLRKNGEITKRLFDIHDYKDDEEMIIAWCRWVKEVDPSIMCGHNIFGFDLPYLAARGDLSLGRDDSDIRFNDYTSKKRKDGSQEYEYVNATIKGRELIDTMFMAYDYDYSNAYISYGLKAIIEHEGLEKEDRIKWDFGEWPAKRIFEEGTKEMWKDFCTYAKDDGDDALALLDLMAPITFYRAQSVPKTYQQINNSATGSQINSIMVRAYLQDGYSLPKASPAVEYEGAISMGIPGIYDNAVKVDVSSLYPSIMRQYEVCDQKKDPKKYFLKLVEYFTEERLKNKKLANDSGSKYYRDMEQAQKILINSKYGFLGSKGLLYNSPKWAAFITKKGREIVNKGVIWATGHKLIQETQNEGMKSEKQTWVLGPKVGKGRGYQLINVDTDAFMATKGDKLTKEEFQTEIKSLNTLFPELIDWEDDGMYDKVVVIRAKNYILKKSGGYVIPGQDPIIYKGSALKDQKKEPALKEMLHEIIHVLLETPSNLTEAIQDIYNQYVLEAMDIKDIRRWAKKHTITSKLLKGVRKNELDVVDAIKDERVQEGDKVWSYKCIDGERQKITKGEPVFFKNGKPKMIPNDKLRLMKYFDGDYHQLHYVDRVWTTAKILENLIDMDLCPRYVQAKNIKLLNDLTND